MMGRARPHIILCLAAVVSCGGATTTTDSPDDAATLTTDSPGDAAVATWS
jgi:hypothetical protein